MNFNQLYDSVFAILRIENNQGKIVGTGFVISANPIRILTCNHVVGDATQDNNGQVLYSITKRTDNFQEFDLRTIQVSFLRATRITNVPEFDLAILEITPAENMEVSVLLGIQNSAALAISFDPDDRLIGSDVEWITTAASSDMTLTPRFFRGNIVTNYIADQQYNYEKRQGINIQQTIAGGRFIEIDKLFIPGCSGGPILNSESNSVIGYVHGFKTWPIGELPISQQVEIVENEVSRSATLNNKHVLTGSLSLGVDMRTIEAYLKDNNLIDS